LTWRYRFQPELPPVGAGLLAMAAYQAMKVLAVPASSLASQLLQVYERFRDLRLAVIHCRSRLAGEGGVSGEGDAGFGLFAGKPAPTGL
jgi:hypothetical protein